MSAITGTVLTPDGEQQLQDLELYVVVREQEGRQLAHVGGTSAHDHDWVAGTLRRLAFDADRQSRAQTGPGR